MLDSIPVSIPVGAVLGFLSGLGIGGGSLLVLWLTLVLGVSQEAARSVNLLFFLPAALTAVYFRARQGALQPRKIVPAIVSGCFAAAAFSLLQKTADTALLRRGFGILLLATGIRELMYRPKNSR